MPVFVHGWPCFSSLIVVTPAALQNLIPGDKGVEQEIVSGEVLDAGSTIAMRAAFSHPELMLPIKELQEVRFDWQCCGCKQQASASAFYMHLGFALVTCIDELHLPSCNLQLLL